MSADAADPSPLQGSPALPPAAPEPMFTHSGAPAASQRPEVGVGAAFAGGLVLAILLKRLA